MARVYPLYSIFIDLDCENRYDRDFVASTLTFWRRFAPERASGRDFFTMYCVFTVKMALGVPRERPEGPQTTSKLTRPGDGSGLSILFDFY